MLVGLHGGVSITLFVLGNTELEVEVGDAGCMFKGGLQDINGPVTLQIGEETIPIKTGGFEANTLPDKQSRSFTGTDWSHKA